MTSTEAHQKLLDLPGGPLSLCGPLEINIHFSGAGDLASIGNALADHPFLGGTYVKVSETGIHTFTASVALQALAVISLLEECGFSIAEIDSRAVEPRRERPVLIGPPGSSKSPAVTATMAVYQSRISQRKGGGLPGIAGRADTGLGIEREAAEAEPSARLLGDVPRGNSFLEVDLPALKAEMARAAIEQLYREIRELGH